MGEFAKQLYQSRKNKSFNTFRIPAKHLEKSELKEVISEIATDLADNRVSKANVLFYLNGKWMKKYG